MKIICFFQENLKSVQISLFLFPLLLVLGCFCFLFCGNFSKEQSNKSSIVENKNFSIKNIGNFTFTLLFFGIFFLSGVAASSKSFKLGTII